MTMEKYKLSRCLKKEDYTDWKFVTEDYLNLLLSSIHNIRKVSLKVEPFHYILRYDFDNRIVYVHSTDSECRHITKICVYELEIEKSESEPLVRNK